MFANQKVSNWHIQTTIEKKPKLKEKKKLANFKHVISYKGWGEKQQTRILIYCNKSVDSIENNDDHGDVY